jgi:hypothetical protein
MEDFSILREHLAKERRWESTKVIRQSILHIWLAFEYNPTDAFVIPYDTRKRIVFKINRFTGRIVSISTEEYSKGQRQVEEFRKKVESLKN